MKRLLILLIIVFMFMSSGCNKNDGIALINDKQIHKDELDKQMVLTEISFKMNGTELPDGENYKEFQIQVLNDIIEDRILVALADDRSLIVDKSLAESRGTELIERIVGHFGSEKAYNDFLKQKNMDADSFNEYITGLCGTKEIILSLYRELTGNINVSENEIKEYYNENPLYYSNSTVSVVDIKAEDKQAANKLYNKIAGENIQVKDLLAYVEGMDSIKGSDMGELYYSDSSQEFSDTVFNMEPGNISKGMSLEDGYHIVGVYDKNIQDPLSYDLVKENVKENLLEQKKVDIYTNYVNENKTKYKTEIYVNKL